MKILYSIALRSKMSLLSLIIFFATSSFAVNMRCPVDEYCEWIGPIEYISQHIHEKGYGSLSHLLGVNTIVEVHGIEYALSFIDSVEDKLILRIILKGNKFYITVFSLENVHAGKRLQLELTEVDGICKTGTISIKCLPIAGNSLDSDLDVVHEHIFIHTVQSLGDVSLKMHLAPIKRKSQLNPRPNYQFIRPGFAIPPPLEQIDKLVLGSARTPEEAQNEMIVREWVIDLESAFSRTPDGQKLD